MIVKRYVQENGTVISDFLFDQAAKGYLTLAFNLLNIGEVLGVFDQYLNRDWIDKATFQTLLSKFIDEILRLLRLNKLIILPTSSSLQMNSWDLVMTKKLYIVDCIQISSCEEIMAKYFVTGDKKLAKAAESLGVEVYTTENGDKLVERIQDEI
jgi:predicted nucleic acid-binding protein